MFIQDVPARASQPIGLDLDGPMPPQPGGINLADPVIYIRLPATAQPGQVLKIDLNNLTKVNYIRFKVDRITALLN